MVSTVTSVPKARSPSSFVSNSQPSRSKQLFLPDTTHCEGVASAIGSWSGKSAAIGSKLRGQNSRVCCG